MPPPAADEILVAVGSTNPVKVRAAEQAFAKCFPDHRVTCYAVKGVRSGVNDQPIGMQETTRGARNRAVAAMRMASAAKAWAPHFAVGLEGGLVTSPSGGSRKKSKKSASGSSPGLDCVAVMAVLERASGRISTATSASFALPPLLTKLVRGGMELGDADDVVFSRTNSKQEDGTVGILTKGVIDRTEYYVHPLVLALVPFVNVELYKKSALPSSVSPPTVWQRYAWQLRENPIRTKALTAAFTTGLGSIIGEVLSGARVSLRRAMACHVRGSSRRALDSCGHVARAAKVGAAEHAAAHCCRPPRLPPPFQYCFSSWSESSWKRSPDKVLRNTNGTFVLW